jgi:hypothetical protein
MRTRIDLQPPRTAAVEAQDQRFIAPLGNIKTAQAFVNVTVNTTASGTTTICFDTTTSPELGLGAGAGAWWVQVGSVSFGVGATGTQTVALTGLGDFLRWRVSTVGAGGSATFEAVVFGADT